jgi:hypothetical protein
VKIPTHVEQGCKLCREYGGSAKSHSTLNCKKWLPGGKSHPEWRGGKTTANINVHQNQGVNQLMAQQAEFQKSILKQISKMSGKKRKKGANALILTLNRAIRIDQLGRIATLKQIFARPKIGKIVLLN